MGRKSYLNNGMGEGTIEGALSFLTGIGRLFSGENYNSHNQYFVDSWFFNEPKVNVLDAYPLIIKNGPSEMLDNDISTMKSLIIPADMRSSDAASAGLLGLEHTELK